MNTELREALMVLLADGARDGLYVATYEGIAEWLAPHIEWALRAAMHEALTIGFPGLTTSRTKAIAAGIAALRENLRVLSAQSCSVQPRP